MTILELHEHKKLHFSRSELIKRIAANGGSALAESIAAHIGELPNGELQCVRPLGEEQPFALRVTKCGGKAFTLTIETNFFVGIDWAVPGVLAVRVRPKIELVDERRRSKTYDTKEIDVLGMLNEILAENFDPEHYDDLLTVRSDLPNIKGVGDFIGLQQFLVADYLAMLHRIVRKGLRRQYLARQEVFNRKLRGRILWSKTFSKPTAHLADRLVCEPVVFTKDTDENRYLKAGLRAADVMLGKLSGGAMSEGFRGLFRLLVLAFEEVSDTDESTRPRFVKTNPVFKDYAEAIAMTKRILDMEAVGYARDDAGEASMVPHWLYMPKLFELYVYAKFRRAIDPEDKLVYHLAVGRQELDYLCDVQKLLETPVGGRYAVADAKYKMLYDRGSIDRDDARQLSGYARFVPVHERLREWGMSPSASMQLLPCLVVHPTLERTAPAEIDFSRIKASDQWLGFSSLGIRLPELKPQSAPKAAEHDSGHTADV